MRYDNSAYGYQHPGLGDWFTDLVSGVTAVITPIAQASQTQSAAQIAASNSAANIAAANAQAAQAKAGLFGMGTAADVAILGGAGLLMYKLLKKRK